MTFPKEHNKGIKKEMVKNVSTEQGVSHLLQIYPNPVNPAEDSKFLMYYNIQFLGFLMDVMRWVVYIQIQKVFKSSM